MTNLNWLKSELFVKSSGIALVVSLLVFCVFLFLGLVRLAVEKPPFVGWWWMLAWFVVNVILLIPILKILLKENSSGRI